MNNGQTPKQASEMQIAGTIGLFILAIQGSGKLNRMPPPGTEVHRLGKFEVLDAGPGNLARAVCPSRRHQ